MFISRILKFIFVSILTSLSLHAITLKDSVERVLSTNPEVIAEKSNQEAFRKYIDERRGNYYPRIDIDGRMEISNSDKNYDNTSGNPADGSQKEDGYNLGIALNQMLYDGNLTPSQVQEAKYNNLANRYRTQTNIDNVVLETVTAYNGLVQYEELLALTKDMISTNEENLEIAKEKEAISGEVLETYQVDSKLNFVKEKYIEEKDLKSSRTSTFKRYVGIEPDGNECRTAIDETKIPVSLQKAVETAVLKNNEILEQIQRAKAQREKIAIADAKFLPNLNLELKAITDNDLSLNEEGVENQAFARINLAWNLYNGGSDYAVSKQEELFLAEQKKRLDAITNKIVEDIKVTYQRYKKNQDRIEVLKKYVLANENIVDVYKSEFEAGTRTFVDILDAQTVLYEAKKSLVNREFELYSNYYSMLNSLSILTDTISNSSNQSCVDKTIVKKEESNAIDQADLSVKTEEVSAELSALLGDETAMTNKVEETPAISLNEDESDVSIETTKIASDDNLESTSFLKAPSKYYTINIATTRGLSKANDYVSKNGLNQAKSYTYEFGPGMKSAKVIYGIFSSVKEANVALKLLPKAVKSAKPYIDNISKHQKLYAKYH